MLGNSAVVVNVLMYVVCMSVSVCVLCLARIDLDGLQGTKGTRRYCDRKREIEIIFLD